MGIYYNAALRGIKNAVKLIDSIEDNTMFNQVSDELHDSLLSIVHFVGDVYPRVKNSNCYLSLPVEEKNFLLAFIYLNNQLKHDTSLDIIYFEVCGSMFPLSFPMRFGPPGVYWAAFEDHGRSREAKREHYETNLMDRDIRSTLTHLEELLLRINNQTT